MRDLTTLLACAVALAGSLTAGALAPEVDWRSISSSAGPISAPRRIVSLALPADELLLAMVEPSRILALEAFVDDPSASNAVAAARAVPGRMHQPISAEAILMARPDLVILPAWSDPQIGALLALGGLPMHRCRSISSLEDVRAEIAELGEIIGESERARALIAEMDARLDAVGAQGRARASRPSVLLAPLGGYTAARGTIFCELVELAGGTCAAADAGYVGNALLPLEHLLALDPEIIVANGYLADARARELVPERPMGSDPRYRTLRAVREGRVVEIPSAHLLATSHHVASLAEDLSRALDELAPQRRAP